MQIKGRIYILLRLLWGSERNSQLQTKSMQYTTRTNYWLPTQTFFHNVIALKQNSKKHGHVYFWVDALCQMMFFSNLFLNFLNPFIF
jgi:hypothetical protein